jgi:hypothetical protein
MNEHIPENKQEQLIYSPEGMDNCNVKEMASLVLEKMTNGECIDWMYWAWLSNITPEQCAKLYYRIDPNTWPDNNYKNGELVGEFKKDIQRLCQLLEGYSERWTLTELVSFLGGHGSYLENTPFGMIDVFQNINLSESQNIERLKVILEKMPKALEASSIAELWAAIPEKSYKNEPFWRVRDDYRKKIEQAAIDGELKALLEIRKPGFDDGFEELTDKNRIRKIEDGWLNGVSVRFTIHREQFQKWLKNSMQWPLDDSCLLLNWFNSEPHTETFEHNRDDTRASQLHSFIWRVRQHIYSTGKGSAQKVWNEIRRHHDQHDTDEIIQEVTATEILWRSVYGNEPKFKRTSLDVLTPVEN